MSGIDKGFLFGILTEVLRGNKRPTFSQQVYRHADTHKFALVRCRGVRRMHLNSNMSACEQAPVSQFGSSAHGSLLRAKSQFEEVNTLDIEKTESYYNQIRNEDLCDCDYCRNNIHEVKAAYPTSFIDTP